MDDEIKSGYVAIVSPAGEAPLKKLIEYCKGLEEERAQRYFENKHTGFIRIGWGRDFLDELHQWLKDYALNKKVRNGYEFNGWLIKQRESFLESHEKSRNNSEEQRYYYYIIDFVQSEITQDYTKQVTQTTLELPYRATYISEIRFIELGSIKCEKFDLSKLIALFEEVNFCYFNKKYYATAMLVRAIIDHVPPIFGFDKFSEVANNYGSRSFKANMKHLDKSMRTIADSYLHQTIRKKEDRPNETQVDCKRDLDVLIGEIVRILSSD